MPIYEHAPLMAGKPRYLDDPGVTTGCLRQVARSGGADFFRRPSWRRELMELECQGDVSPHSIQQALAAQLPAGVRVHRAEEVPARERSRVVGIVYRFQLPPGQTVAPQAVSRLLAQPRIEVARGRDGAKRVDIRPYIKNIRVREPSGGRGQVLTALLSVEPTGTAKASPPPAPRA